jgi:hypothetical protein
MKEVASPSRTSNFSQKGAYVYTQENTEIFALARRSKIRQEGGVPEAEKCRNSHIRLSNSCPAWHASFLRTPSWRCFMYIQNAKR